MKFLDIYSEILQEIYHYDNNAELQRISDVIDLHIHQIVNRFYATMVDHPDARHFLETQLVEQRLKLTMAVWIKDVFTPKTPDAVKIVIDRQIVVGQVHARIKIPMTLVFLGSNLLKRELSSLIIASEYSVGQREQSLVLMHRVIDAAIAIISEVYLQSLLENEKNSHALRLHHVSHELALECEQARASLLHWYREIATRFLSLSPNTPFPSVVSIWQSRFGLWAVHRASLLFYNERDSNLLHEHLVNIDKSLLALTDTFKACQLDIAPQNIAALNTAVLETDWLLENLSKQIIAAETSKDPLTRLMTRRYLPNIMQHEIEFALNKRNKFAVLLIDLDHFKTINDDYGHSVGDMVLAELAKALVASVRPADYLIRYGGEEFLLVLTSISDSQQAIDIAEKIRRKIATHSFSDLTILKHKISVSIGIGIFDGHPDYERLINNADQALYRAKQLGRNRVEIFAA